ncbi:MAG: flippase-like domain-containing protein [Magnetococcales bacterium]|nr:flippase-like domain-containing protein [Magnetococcales bacterium]
MNFLKLIIAALLIYWLADSNQLDFSAVSDGFFSLGQLLVATALLLGFAGQALRWASVMKMHQITIPLRDVLRIFWIGQFFFMTTLGMAGGEAARTYYISRYSGGRTVAAISTAFIDRLLGLYTFTILGSIAFLTLSWQTPQPLGVQQMGWVALLLFFAISSFFVLLYQPKLRYWVINYLPELWQQRIGGFFSQGEQSIKQLSKLLFISIATNITMIVAFKLSSDILHAQLGWLAIFLITPLVIIANSLPVSFGGLGVGEAAAQTLMAQVGINNGAEIMLLIRAVQWVTVLPIGLFFYLIESKKSAPDKNNETKTAEN